MSRDEALDFVSSHGVVLESARGPVPNLAEAVAGEAVGGRWWSHPRASEIFQVLEAVRDSGEVLVCRLVSGRVSYVHRRLWPALLRLAEELPAQDLAWIREVHTERGRHRVEKVPFPKWVPEEVLRQAGEIDPAQARVLLAAVLPPPSVAPRGRGPSKRRRRS